MKGKIKKQKALAVYWIETKDGSRYHLHSDFNRINNLDENKISSDYVDTIVSFELDTRFHINGFDGVVCINSLVFDSNPQHS